MNIETDRARRRRLKYLTVWILWTGFGVTFAALNWAAREGMAEMGSLPFSLFRETIVHYWWVLVSPLVFRLVRKYPLEGKRSALNLLLLLVWGAVLVAAHFLYSATIEKYILIYPPYTKVSFLVLYKGYVFFNSAYSSVMYVSLLGIGYLFDYQERYLERSSQATRLTVRAAELEAQLTQARLDALKAQLNPHFLFNAMNSVSALIDEDGPAARRMLESLGWLLRATLDDTVQGEVELQRELALMRQFADMYQIRFRNSLEVHIEAEAGTERALVPAFLLQPLVENALRHGARPMEELTLIDVRARRSGDALLVEVLDNGPGLPASPTRDGHGLRATKQRLAHIYGPAASFHLEPRPDGGAVARVHLPFYTSKDIFDAAPEPP